MNQLILKHGAIINPRYKKSLVRNSELKNLRIFQDRIVIGKKEIRFENITNRYYKDGAIYIEINGEMLRFALRGVGSKNPDAFFTGMINDLLDAVEKNDLKTVEKIRKIVRYGRIQFALGAVLFIILLIVASGATATLLAHGAFENTLLLVLWIIFGLFFLFRAPALSFRIAALIVFRK